MFSGEEAGRRPKLRLFDDECPISVMEREMKIDAMDQKNVSSNLRNPTSLDGRVPNQLIEEVIIAWTRSLQQKEP